MKIIKFTAIAVCLLVLPLVRSGHSEDNPFKDQRDVRTWTDASGKFKVVAKLDGIDGDVAKLVKSDGKTVKVPLDKLSSDDMTYIEEWQKKKSGNDAQLEAKRKEHVTWRVRSMVTERVKMPRGKGYAYENHKKLVYKPVQGELVSYVGNDVTIAVETRPKGKLTKTRTTFTYDHLGQEDCHFLDEYRKLDKGDSPKSGNADKPKPDNTDKPQPGNADKPQPDNTDKPKPDTAEK
jgi:hypothetical protein